MDRTPIFFADFELEPGTHELRRHGRVVPLERQPAIALTLLATRAGRLVTRDELRSAIWPADTFVDFDRGLNYCLRQVRIALGDDARSPRFIETVPRQGYRFIATTRREVAEELATPPIARRRRTWRLAVASLALVVAGAVIAESGPRNESHHEIAVSLARTMHDWLF